MPTPPHPDYAPIRRDLESLEEVALIVTEYARGIGKDPRTVSYIELRKECGIAYGSLKSLGGIKRLRELLLLADGIEPNTPRASSTKEAIEKIVRACKAGPISRSRLADILDVAPRRVDAYLEDCRARGIDVHVEGEHVATKRPQRAEVIDSKVKPVAGEPFRVASVSDTHLGSKYCMRAQLADFLINAKKLGCQAIVHTGDVLEGNYRHAAFERTHHGLEEQIRDLRKSWPNVGLPVIFITGNHDETFWSATGVDVGKSIERAMNEAGHDWTHVGDRGAFVEIGGVVMHLWHPKQGSSYAKSYGLQKKAEGFTSLKPQVMIAGHWHQFSYVDDRAIHSMSAGCFQGGQSAFAKSLRGSIAMGGTILQWSTTEDGTIRRFSLERHSYYEIEEPIRVNSLPGEAVPKALSRATWEPGE